MIHSSSSSDDDVVEMPAAPPENTPTKPKDVSDCHPFTVVIPWVIDGATVKKRHCFICHRDAFVDDTYRTGTAVQNTGWRTKHNHATNLRTHFETHMRLLNAATASDREEQQRLKKEAATFTSKIARCNTISIQQQFQKASAEQTFKTDKRTFFITPSLSIVLNDIEHVVVYFITSNTAFAKLRPPPGLNEPSLFVKLWEGIRPGVKFPSGICERNHPEKIAELAKKVREVSMSHFAGKDVTLITDKGRIWNDYLPLCIVDASTGELFLYDLVHIDRTNGDIADSRAATMVTVVNAAVKELKKRAVNVIAICTDNASNMVKLCTLLARSENPVLPVGCVCHGIALLHDTAIATCDRWNELVARALELRRHYNTVRPSGHDRPLPEANETRWSSKFRLMSALVSNYKDIIASLGENIEEKWKFDESDLEFLAAMNTIMESFQVATRMVESNRSTVVHAALAYQQLYDASRVRVPRVLHGAAPAVQQALIVRSQKRFVLPDLLTIFLFFLPIVHRASFKDTSRPGNEALADFTDLRSFVTAIICDPCLIKAFGIDVLSATLEGEVHRFCEAGNDPYRAYNLFRTEESISISAARKFYSEKMKAYPNLEKVLAKAMSVVVNEAGVERLFSTLGGLVSNKQMRQKPKKVFDMLSIKLAFGGASAMKSEKERAKLVREYFVGAKEDDDGGGDGYVVADDDVADEDELEHVLDNKMITKEMCHFALEQALLGYRDRSEVDRVCALCYIQPNLSARQLRSNALACLKEDAFQCPKCTSWYGLAHVNGENDTQTNLRAAFNQQCYYCVQGMSGDVRDAMAKNKIHGSRRERANE